MRVSQLTIQRVGPFERQEFDFSIEENHPDIHIFTGKNGSGKTTILHAIASFFDHFEEGHKEHLSNLFFKRFHSFSLDKNGNNESFVYGFLNNEQNKRIEEVAVYGCNGCKNIHQNYIENIPLHNLPSRKEEKYQKKPASDKLINYRNAIVSKSLDNKSFEFAAFGYSGYRFIKSSQITINEKSNFNPLHLALEFVKEKNTGFLVSNWMVSQYSKSAIERMKGNNELADKYMHGVQTLQDAISELTDNEIKFEIKTNPWKVLVLFHGKEIEFDVLPDGLRSMLSWLGDLLMRLDAIPWANDTVAINEQNIILLLDEIEVHLHPKWQYHILPLTRKLFPKAQIFLSTHSPFVINSIDNAKIHILEVKDGVSQLKETRLSNTGYSYSYVYDSILETTEQFGQEAVRKLAEFKIIRQELSRRNFTQEERFRQLIVELKDEGEEVMDIVISHIRRLDRVLDKNYSSIL